jgi:hypothetical protein
MIYQLLRRDPAWRLTPFAAAAAGLCVLAASKAVGILVFATLLGVWPFLAGVHRRATLFQAALPIPAKDMFVTRCVALTSLLWLPVLAAAGVAVLKGGLEWKGAAPALIDCGAAATLITIALLPLRLMEIESPPQLVMSLWYLGAGAFLAAFLTLPSAPVLAFCAIASVALFLRAWRAMPESFQVAPLEARKPSRHRQAESEPAIPWLILLRSVIPLRGLLFLPLVFQVLFTHAASWPLVCFVGIFGVTGLLQPQNRWLHALPVARRKLLAIVTAVTLYVVVLYSISVAFGWGGRPGFRLGVINVVCIMLVCMSELILVVAWGSHRIRRLPMWSRQIVFIPAAIVVVLGGPARMLSSRARTAGIGRLETFLLDLSRRLPENPAAIVVLGAIAFAAMFWLLEKLDAQAEWPELLSQGPARE